MFDLGVHSEEKKCTKRTIKSHEGAAAEMRGWRGKNKSWAYGYQCPEAADCSCPGDLFMKWGCDLVKDTYIF